MRDRITLRQKLLAMAKQNASPREAENARAALDRLADLDARTHARVLAAPARGAGNPGVYWPHYIRWIEPETRVGPLPIPDVARVPTVARRFERRRFA